MNHFKTISDYHSFANLPAPEHPLISLVAYNQIAYPKDWESWKLKHEYYVIGLKRNVPYKFYYGQQTYDFNEGVMTFIAPNQVLSMEHNPNLKVETHLKPSGWLLLIHPDFFWKTALVKKIKSYDFFNYTTHEALFVSLKEEAQVVTLFKSIEQEYQGNLDPFSQKIIVAHLELLLNYAERFYQRQFLTRNKSNHQIIEKVELWLATYFKEAKGLEKGLPTVEQLAEAVCLSPSYLSSLLTSVTGMSALQHIHASVISLAKEQLANTQLSVSQIAYDLGFGHPSSFHKLFKKKTQMSPLEFRTQCN
ncbi:helix-turn-helix domain-containing protein [Ochrovirga pacifica]|uniref:helix-turn-helix domain-containing protein n=1 Tax=Ochrovirga pacifica TaxID=1042376 RepID=UPI0003181677|nr:helix-turn-helix transcriptional regulator [Ochrovirga pacifica]